jgi:hypothetical protein
MCDLLCWSCDLLFVCVCVTMCDNVCGKGVPTVLPEPGDAPSAVERGLSASEVLSLPQSALLTAAAAAAAACLPMLLCILR